MPRPEWVDEARPLAAAMTVVLLAGVMVLARLGGLPAEVAAAEHVDAATGVRFAVPPGWRETSPAREEEPLDPPSRQVAFRGPAPGARIEAAFWNAEPARAPLLLWIGVTAGEFQPVDQRALPNASVGGDPAAVVWRSSAEDARLEYAVFFAIDGAYVRLRYSAPRDGAVPEDFAAVLRTLSVPQPGLSAFPVLPGP